MADNHAFRQLLTDHCTPIVRQITDAMHPRLFPVKQVQDGAKLPVSHDPVLYRWWFPEDPDDSDTPVVWQVLLEHSHKDPALAALLDEVEQRTIDGKPYRALYFGKSNNGYHRFYQHIRGTVRISTVRHTVYGLCIPGKYNADHEPTIDKILSRCYCEWTDFGDDGNLVGCFEEMCIALGKYPLNVDGNPAIGDEWRDILMEGRKTSKKKKTIRYSE